MCPTFIIRINNMTSNIFSSGHLYLQERLTLNLAFHVLTVAILFSSTGAPAQPVLVATPSSFSNTQSVNLQCSTSTSGITTFSYMKNGETVSGATTDTLSISSFTSSDTGEYSCKAITGSGIQSVSSQTLQLAASGLSKLSHTQYQTNNLLCASLLFFLS